MRFSPIFLIHRGLSQHNRDLRVFVKKERKRIRRKGRRERIMNIHLSTVSALPALALPLPLSCPEFKGGC